MQGPSLGQARVAMFHLFGRKKANKHLDHVPVHILAKRGFCEKRVKTFSKASFKEYRKSVHNGNSKLVNYADFPCKLYYTTCPDMFCCFHSPLEWTFKYRAEQNNSKDAVSWAHLPISTFKTTSSWSCDVLLQCCGIFQQFCARGQLDNGDWCWARFLSLCVLFLRHDTSSRQDYSIHTGRNKSPRN